MKILIVGGVSALGIALNEAFKASNNVITAGRRGCDITVDITDDCEGITFPDGIDIVIHTAAHFGGTEAKDILAAINVNVLGTAKVCKAAIDAGVKHFVLISSIFVFKGSMGIRDDAYSISKRHSEEVATLLCSKFSIPLTILRPSQIYGNTHSFSSRQPFLSRIIDKALMGEPIDIYGSRDAKINLIHIKDLVKIVSHIIIQKLTGVYSCCHPINTSYCEFAKTAFSIVDKRPMIRFLNEMRDIEDLIFENDLMLYSAIEFSPETNLREGILEIITERLKLV
jgi:nucleoside-diphosphate-sugar epimerase